MSIKIKYTHAFPTSPLTKPTSGIAWSHKTLLPKLFTAASHSEKVTTVYTG